MSVIVGDCVEAMAAMEPCSVDAICTDPPYLISFMGKEFDSQAKTGRAMQEWHERWAVEALRVLKPGGHLLAFGGTRTYHRLVCAVEDAGFEIRDSITWIYGSGFPKSLDVSKALDRAAGAEREVVGEYVARGFSDTSPTDDGRNQWAAGAVTDKPAQRTAPATPDAEKWQGWGTALKPASEPIVVARKPLSGTVAVNVLAHGTGALNVDGCRIKTGDKLGGGDQRAEGAKNHGVGWDRPWMHDPEAVAAHAEQVNGNVERAEALGRWPANVVLTHSDGCVQTGTRRIKAITGTAAGRMGENYQSDVYGGYTGNSDEFGKPTGLGDADGMETVEAWDCVEGCPIAELDAQSGAAGGSGPASGPSLEAPYEKGVAFGARLGTDKPPAFYGDKGGASRFFYCAKSARAERNAGLAGFEKKPILWSSGEQNPGSFQAEGTDRSARNPHPTVKPIDLMRWLVRLVTPPGGVVLDPFLGSGTTGCAAALEGFEFIGIEREAEYAAIAEARIRFWAEHPTGLPVEVALKREAERGKVRDSGQGGLF